MTRYSLTWAAAALLGIITTAVLAWSASQIASQPIGITSEPLSVASGLAPREIGPLNQVTVPHRRSSPRSTPHRAPAARSAVGRPAVALGPPALTGSVSTAAAPSRPAPAPAQGASTPAAAASPQPKTPSASRRAPAPSASVASRGEDRPSDGTGSSSGSGSRGSPGAASAGGHRDD